MHIMLFGGSFNPPHLGHLIVIQQAFELIPNLDELWILPCYRHTFLKNLAPAQHRLKMCELLVNEPTLIHSPIAEGGEQISAGWIGQSGSAGLASLTTKGKTQIPHRMQPKKFRSPPSKTISSRVKVCPIEIDFKLSGETYEALHKLRSETDYLQQKMNLSSSSLLHTSYSFLMGTDQLTGFKKWGNWEELLKKMPFYIYPRAGYTNDIKFPNMMLLESATQVVTNVSSTLIRDRIEQGLPIAHLLPPSVLKYLRLHRLY